jgi:hypothetical protein
MQDITKTPNAPAAGHGLTKRRKAVAEYIVTEGCDRTEAVRRAGFAEGSANREAWRLFNNPAFVEYLHHLTWQKVGEGAARAASVMNDLLHSGSDDVKLRASKDLMDRAGIKHVESGAKVGNITVNIDLG